MVDFLRRYTNVNTRNNTRKAVRDLLAHSPTGHPGDLSVAQVIEWCTTGTGRTGGRLANNTIRQRLSTARTFLRWCAAHGVLVPNPSDDDLGLLRKSFPKTYGKAQDVNPARYLSYDEAYGQLVPACSDGTWIGSRDQLVIRFGLAGIRAAEIAGLRWGDLHPNGELHWIGKKNRHRSIDLGPRLTELLGKWRRRYESDLGRPVSPNDPIICRARPANWRHPEPRIAWGIGLSPQSIWDIVHARAQRSGLGHVAPHDLRRSAAKIMHDARTPDGGHLFDLDDIATVLDHVDPATTRRSYLDRIDRTAKRNAGQLLD